MAEPMMGFCPHDEDSALSKTSNITGIMTFCVAIIIGTWLRFHTWNSAEKEFEDFVKYIELHKIELNWMRDLLSDTMVDGPANHAIRPLPIGQISAGRPLSPTLERPNARDQERKRLRDAAAKDLDWRDRWRKFAYAAVKRAHNDRAVIEAVQQEIRCSRMKKKRNRRAENADRDKDMFGKIFKMIDQLDRSLQKLVDDVKRKPPEESYETRLAYLQGRQGSRSYLPTERFRQRPLSAIRIEIEEPAAANIEATARVNSAPQLSRARQLSGDARMPLPLFRSGSLPEGSSPQAQNFVLQPMEAVLSRRNQPQAQAYHTENGILPTIEFRASQPALNGIANGWTAASTQPQAPNGIPQHAVEFVDPTPFRDASEPPESVPSKPLQLPRSLSSRIAYNFQTRFPNSWFAKYYIAWNWLRKREEAWKLRRERDVQWNRVHASQLALLTRRIEDQDEQLDLLDFNITLHNRLIQRASWTRSRR